MNLILDFFLVGGIVIIAIILLRLLRIKSKELPQKVLILLFLLLFFVAVYFYALLHNINWLIKLCFLPNDITIITLGPLLFLYVKSLFLKEDKLIKNTLAHFIPTFLFAFGITIPTILFNNFEIDELAYTQTNFIRSIIRIENLYLILYLIISSRLLSKYRKLTKYKYSNLTKYDFNWIKIMLLSSLGIISVDLGFKIYESFFGNFQWNVDNISVLAMIVLVSYLAYYGVNQSKVLLPSFLLDNEIESEINKKKKKTLSSEKKEEFENLKNKLELIIKTEQPYLDEDLTLGKLAKQLSTTDKKLSTMLNQYLSTTFYDLINKYRVEAVKEKINLDNYKNYNLFGIASECGFKSRTSFNRIFKKETGRSPSDFKKSIS
ncbi:helix-turn-helix domain-containing protein [Polaribacter sp. Hel1_85]|uniref:helix-turn-helix domain-containing protein n=1 Tax=Polaribacter sp. Hel1_85 TaxID=1250005 RepID=UPI00052D1C6E|nr:helix-turn-helix domain-containing protein [Polaribacter sp. Hel1_85]KGL61746.1 transcriptional regulator, AraC family [Polaribacter sp. Hel1_85]